MSRGQPQAPSVEVEAKELRAALRTLANFSGKGEAVLRHEDGELIIELGGSSVSVPATGDWQGRARLAGEWLRAYSRTAPGSGRLVVAFRDGRLSLGSLSLAATWQDLAPEASIDLPINPSLELLLALPEAFSEAEITSAGLEQVVEEASERKARLVKAALRALKPLPASEDDILGVIDRIVRRAMPPQWDDRC